MGEDGALTLTLSWTRTLAPTLTLPAQVAILGEDGGVLPFGRTGRIALCGCPLMRGYENGAIDGAAVVAASRAEKRSAVHGGAVNGASRKDGGARHDGDGGDRAGVSGWFLSGGHQGPTEEGAVKSGAVKSNGADEAGGAGGGAGVEGGWFLTGDNGYMDEEGGLYVTGREKDVINRGGETIAPVEIEEVSS